MLFLVCFFLFLLAVAFFPPVEKNFIAGLGGLTVAFERYLNKRNNNNKLWQASEKAKLGVCSPEKETPGEVNQ